MPSLKKGIAKARGRGLLFFGVYGGD